MTSAAFVESPNRRTYRYAQLAVAPVASPTDVVIIKGSATTITRVKRVAVAGAATAAGTMPIQLVKRSGAPSIGSAVLTAVTPAQHDSLDDPPTAVVSVVSSANVTVGTSAGVVGTGRLQMTALATGLAAVPVIWEFATRQSKPVSLRGVSESLCINLNGAALPSGGVIDFEIETEEELLV